MLLMVEVLFDERGYEVNQYGSTTDYGENDTYNGKYCKYVCSNEDNDYCSSNAKYPLEDAHVSLAKETAGFNRHFFFKGWAFS